jgi:hypothetical protein
LKQPRCETADARADRACSVALAAACNRCALPPQLANADNRGWSLYGAPWLQPVAISGKSRGRKNRRNEPKPLRRVATGCRQKYMVRRGSTVRVRQRALQNASITHFLFSDLLAGARTWGRYGARHGAFRSRTPPATFLLELAALEPATSCMRTRGSDASPALTGCPDDATSLDAARRHSRGLQRRRSRWRALDAMRTRNARLVHITSAELKPRVLRPSFGHAFT